MLDEIQHYDMYINGGWRKSSRRIERANPRSGEIVSTYAQATKADTVDAINASVAAFRGPWRKLTAEQRAELILKASRLLLDNMHELGKVEADETGKPLSDALDDIRAGVKLWQFAASSLRMQHGSIYPALDGNTVGLTMIEPVGVVGLITPWNFPFIVTAERLPFILAAGCTVVMKPSEYASGTALLTAKILTEAGIPAGVFNVVTGLADETGVPITEHPDVAMISFTGSSEHGRRVMAAASKTLKRVSLELGGKSPILVFADAQIEQAADAVISGFTHNAGQCCIATTRLLVEGSIAKSFETLLAKKLQSKFGAGSVQPVANAMQFAKVRSAISKGLQKGRCVFGTSEANQKGHFVMPVVIADLPDDDPLLREEIFGPVLTMQVFDGEEEALRLANDTVYGLAASIWTEDHRRALRCATTIRAGRIWINAEQVNYPELPIGGFNMSGIGREAGPMGITTYSEVKTVIMR